MNSVFCRSKESWEGFRASRHLSAFNITQAPPSRQLPPRTLLLFPYKAPLSSASLAGTPPHCTPFLSSEVTLFKPCPLYHTSHKRMTDFRIGEKYTPGSPPMAAQSYFCYTQNFFEVSAFYLKNSYKFCTPLYEICVLVLILKYYFKLLTSE